MQIPRKKPGAGLIPSPEHILAVATGAWSAGILGAAIQHNLFTHLDHGVCITAEIARRADLSLRGTQALLDGLVAMGFVFNRDGDYINSAESSAFLVEGRPGYLGAYIRLEGMSMEQWAHLPEAVQSGSPPTAAPGIEHNHFWTELAQALIPLSYPVARVAMAQLGIVGAGPISILDVGGGSGIFSAVFLHENSEAQATQVDHASVNRMAREVVSAHGIQPERFITLDGDFHHIDLGSEAHDVVIYSHMAQAEAPEANRYNFRRIHQALKPGGTLAIVDMVLDDLRTGHPLALLYNANMFMRTVGGSTYTRAQYRNWLESAGFRRVSFVPTEGPATLVMAET